MELAMNELKSKNPKILVIGDLIIDHYLWGSCDRVSAEAPVQVVNIQKENLVLGGAGNVINNLKSLGADVDMISVIGECQTSKELESLFEEINVKTNFLTTQKDRITSKKTRIIAAQQQVVRFDSEISEEINNESINSVLESFKKNFLNYDAILLSDYGKGVLTFNLTQSIISLANQNSLRVLVDPKGLDYSKYKGAFLLTPNKKEASEATNINIHDENSLMKAIKALKKEFELTNSIVTLSEQGVAVYDNNLRIHPTVAKEVFDVTGAGDTILAALGFALSCNKNIDDAIKFSNLAAGVVVGKIGAATATIDEIINYESRLNKSSINHSIKSWNEIKDIAREIKNGQNKIVFSNGCFDILHAGHVKYLEKAKSFGDFLILGLNSDKSVNKLKGDNRPINSELNRAQVLAAIEVVDYVVIFDQETPLELIKHIQPNVIVKGGDYNKDSVVGSNEVEEVKIVEFTEGLSTSNVIEKIKNS